MKNVITIKDLTFAYGQNIIIDKLNLDIKQGTFTTIIGPNGSGKSTLIKILLGLLPNEADIEINELKLNKDNLAPIRRSIGVVFENPDNQFVAETVMDDIAFSLENIGESPNTIKKKIKTIAEYLNIKHLLECEPHSLSGGEKQLVALASALIIEPKILLLDEAFTMVDNDTREQIYKILKEVNKDKNITIINVTHDIDDSLYGENIIVIDEGKIILNGPTELVLTEEKIFNDLDMELPFIASLSIKLKYYGLVDRLILNMDELVNTLWK